jgi:hypothetical protein
MSLTQINSRYMDTTSDTMKAAYQASAELAIETQSIYERGLSGLGRPESK